MSQTQSQYIVTLTANPPGGTPRSLGTWTEFSGGGAAAEVVPDRGPLDEFPTQSGAEKTLAEITVGRRVDASRDTDELDVYLDSLVSVTNAITVQRKKVVNKVPFGSGRTWVATLTANNAPDSDNNSTGDAATHSLTLMPSRKS